MFMKHHNDTTIKTDAQRKTQEWRTHEGRHRKTSLQIYLPLTLLQGFERFVQGFTCERVLETEHKLHILTLLLWPSRCVFLVLLDAQPEVLGSTDGCWLSLWHLISIFSGPLTPSGVSEDPLGRVWLSLPHLVSNSLEFYWQLLWHPELNWVK